MIDQPKVGDTTYEAKLISSFNAVDNHDHSSGKGEPVAAIDSSTVDNVTIEINSGNARVKPASLGISKFVGGLVPVGTIVPYVGSSAPTGWFVCDGTAVSRTTYSNLFNVIGEAWGEGNNSTTFNIPDTRGMFLRGRANTSTNDPDRTSRTNLTTGSASGDNVGSYQADEATGHTHTGNLTTGIRGRYNDGSVGCCTMAAGDVGAMNTNATTGLVSGTYKDGTANTNESRPVNISVNYIIKY